jgi:hypothetical protein
VRKRTLAGASAAVMGLAVVGAGCAADSGPRLDAATPAASARGTMVELTGARLCGGSGDCTIAGGEVDLGREPPMVRATVVAYAATALKVVVPASAPVGATAWIITVDEQASNALDFEVLP